MKGKLRSQNRTPAPAAPKPRGATLARLSAALVGATLATTVLITADAVSVYFGESLPQILLILLTGLSASLANVLTLRKETLKSYPFMLLTLLVGWLVLSTLYATWISNGRVAWNGFWHVLGLLVFGLVVRQFCRAPLVARAIMQLLLLGAIVHATHAIHQVTVSLPATRAQYLKDPDGELAKLQVDAPPGSPQRAQYESRLLYSTEPVATFALTNSLAVLLSAAIVVLGILLASHFRAVGNRWLMLFEGFVLALLISAWLLTKSRTAFLAVVIVGIAWGAVHWWRRRPTGRAEVSSSSLPQSRWLSSQWLAGGVLTFVLLFCAFLFLLSRDILVLSEAPKSLAFRLEYWQATAKMIFDYPLTGVGFGNFQSYYPRYKVPTASETIADPHNWLFDIAATCSLPVLAIVLLGLGAIIGRSLSLLRRGDAWRSDTNKTEPLEVVAWLQATSQQQIVRALWVGAAVGWFFTALLQLVLQEMIDIEASTYGLIVASVAIAIMQRTTQPSALVVQGAALAAATVMLVCLLTSGSWQASGLALPLASWFAIACPARALWPTNVKSTGGRDMLAALVLVGLLAAFLLQTWRPVHMSWTLEQNALAALELDDAQSAAVSARASIAADPLSAAPRRLLVHILAAQAEQQSIAQLKASSQQVEVALTELLASDSSTYLNWTLGAETMLTLAASAQASDAAALPSRISGAPDVAADTKWLSPLAKLLLGRADYYCRGAIDRYPSSVAHRAQHAVILALLDDYDAAQDELTSAFTLSTRTPHLDRKLQMQQVWLPESLALFPEQAIVRPTARSAWVKAEPLCEHLRKK